MPVRRPVPFALALGAVLLAGPRPCRGESVTQDEFVQLDKQWLDARARNIVLQREVDLLGRGPKESKHDADYRHYDSAAAALRAIDAELNHPDGALRKSRDARLAVLKKLGNEAAGGRVAALQRWEEACRAWLSARDERVQTQARQRGPLLGRLERLDVPTLLPLGGGLLLVLAGFILAAHAGRVGLRRLWRSGLAALAVVTLLPAASAVTTDYLGTKYADKEKELGQLKEANEKLDRKVGDLRRARLDHWKELLSLPDKREAPPVGAELARLEEEAHQLLRQSMIDLETIALAREETTRLDREKAGEIAKTREIEQEGRQERWTDLGFRLACLVGGPLVALLAVWLAHRDIRRQRRRDYNTCPRDLSQGTLVNKKSAVEDSRYPEPRYTECTACAHEFPTSQRSYPRLCFPTVGVRASGKTFWLVTAYELIKHNRVPTFGGGLDKAPSLADAEFDVFVQTVLEQCRGTAPTRYHLPAPLTFHARDGDGLGRNSLLLNLFDYAGEMMDARVNTDVLRRRALNMDGFLLFLDPTQVTPGLRVGDLISLGLNRQIDQVTSFRQEMRLARDLSESQPLNVPVAVCVSKLDQVAKWNPMGGQAVQWVRKLRQTAGAPLTLTALRERSDMLAEVMGLLFPGWDVAKALRESFGDRFLFFPMTPVGVEEHCLRATTLAECNPFVPFGTLEPILWLLHMHGYQVLRPGGKGGGR